MPHRDIAPTGAPCWIEIFSSDTDKARAFYGSLFGWESEAAVLLLEPAGQQNPGRGKGRCFVRALRTGKGR